MPPFEASKAESPCVFSDLTDERSSVRRTNDKSKELKEKDMTDFWFNMKITEG